MVRYSKNEMVVLLKVMVFLCFSKKTFFDRFWEVYIMMKRKAEEPQYNSILTLAT